MSIEAGRRYPDLERKFVTQACSRAGMVTNQKTAAIHKIADHVSERLTKGAEEYGASQFWHVPMVGEGTERGNSLVGELQEEAADIFGWGALLSIRLREKGWTDLVTGLEVATANLVFYGDHLKQIESQIKMRLAES